MSYTRMRAVQNSIEYTECGKSGEREATPRWPCLKDKTQTYILEITAPHSSKLKEISGS